MHIWPISKLKCQFGFRKGFSVRKASLGNKYAFLGALLTNLSKVFDCLNHQLFIAKLHSYGLDFTSLKLVHSYFNNRKQKRQIKYSFNAVLELEQCFTRISCGATFFNIHICWFFLHYRCVGNYKLPHVIDIIIFDVTSWSLFKSIIQMIWWRLRKTDSD